MLTINVVKKLFIIGSGIFAYLTMPLIAFAVTPDPSSVNPCDATVDKSLARTLCNLSQAGFGGIVQGVVVFFIVIAVVVALIYLLYGGVKWITSKGEKTEVEAARNHITAAIAGLIIVFLAIFILNLILTAFGLSLGQLVLPVIGQ